MFQVFSGITTYLLPGDQALKVVKGAINIINSTNKFVLTKNITLIMLAYSILLPVSLVFSCAGVVVTLGYTIYLVTEIYESC